LLTKGDKNMLINQETGAFVAEFPARVKWMAFLLDDYTWCWNDKKEYAIVDRNGQVQYRAAAGQIQDVKGFRNGLTPVKTKTGWGIMDHQGQWIVSRSIKILPWCRDGSKVRKMSLSYKVIHNFVCQVLFWYN
jgi:hypothetical protein